MKNIYVFKIMARLFTDPNLPPVKTPTFLSFVFIFLCFLL